MTYDVSRIRASYPALADGSAYLDGAAGTQVPQAVIDAIVDTYRGGLSNMGGTFPSSHRANELDAAAREAVADLVGGSPEGVILGANMTTLTYRLSSTLSRTWREGDEVVASKLDHDANVRPWVQAAEHAGATLRWAEVDPKTGELPVEQFDDLLTERTKLVAVTAASNILGTRPDLPAIAARAHAVGALMYVDGVHATPHGPVSVEELGADFYATSAYKWSGPHIGAVIAKPSVLEDLHPDKLTPAPDNVPVRFETGTPPYADYAAAIAAVDHLAALDPDARGSRRERVLASMTAAEAHEQSLFAELLAGLEKLPGVTLYGRPARRTATAFFNLEGHAPRDVAQGLADRRVNVWSGIAYAYELTGVLGIRETGGAVRAGLVHYNDASDVRRLLDGLAEIAETPSPVG